MKDDLIRRKRTKARLVALALGGSIMLLIDLFRESSLFRELGVGAGLLAVVTKSIAASLALWFIWDFFSGGWSRPDCVKGTDDSLEGAKGRPEKGPANRSSETDRSIEDQARP